MGSIGYHGDAAYARVSTASCDPPLTAHLPSPQRILQVLSSSEPHALIVFVLLLEA